MRKIVFLLMAMAGCLGMKAQKNPQMAELVDEVNKIEGSFVHFKCEYDGAYKEEVSIFLEARQEYQRVKLDNDSIVEAIDSLARLWTKIARPMNEAIRRTCREIAKDAEESYMWESHVNGMDSIRYAIMMKRGKWVKERNLSVKNEHDAYMADEFITYEYTPYSWKKKVDFPEKEWPLNGMGNMFYRYNEKEDSLRGRIEVFDKEEYKKLMEDILKPQEGMVSRPIYIRHDDSYPEPTGEDEMAYTVKTKYQHEKKDGERSIWTEEDRLPLSESRCMLYTLKSKEKAEEILRLIEERTKNYVNEHPRIRYKFYPKQKFDEGLRLVFAGENKGEEWEDIRILVHRHNYHEFHILLCETKGDLWIPAEWPEMKSWKNGKIKYYTNRMTKLERRVYTRSRDWEDRR